VNTKPITQRQYRALNAFARVATQHGTQTCLTALANLKSAVLAATLNDLAPILAPKHLDHLIRHELKIAGSLVLPGISSLGAA